LQAQIRDEVNVLTLESLAGTDELVDVAIKANFKSLGARYGKTTPVVAAAIAAADARELVAALRGGEATVNVEGKDEVVTLDDVVITEVPREGWTVASENGESLALDLELNADLIAQGIARDITRMIQDARKASGFEISDRIHVTWNSSNTDTTAALENYGSAIAAEVLATEWAQGETTAPQVSEDELGVNIQIVRAASS